MVVCQLEIPIEAVQRAFEIARAAGVRTLLNPAPAADAVVGPASVDNGGDAE
jgi:ribokinase